MGRDPRDELNELLNGAVEVATELLEKDGEFLPFALALRTDGEFLHLSAEDEGDDVDPEDRVRTLRASLRDARTRYRATAVVADVTMEDETEQAVTAAIHIAMEHAIEEPVSCYIPYEFAGDTLELAELVGEPGDRFVFEAALPN